MCGGHLSLGPDTQTSMSPHLWLRGRVDQTWGEPLELAWICTSRDLRQVT